MGINPKILDKLIKECKDDPEARGILQEFLVMENDKTGSKEEYIKVIESAVKECDTNED